MIKLKLNTNFKYNGKTFNKDSVVKVKVDKSGNILDSFWARRLRDSVIDNCVEVVQEKTTSKKDSK